MAKVQLNVPIDQKVYDALKKRALIGGFKIYAAVEQALREWLEKKAA